MLETILVLLVNAVSGNSAQILTSWMLGLAQHYVEICNIIRWTFPCVMTSLLLFCLLVPSKNQME